MNNMKTYPEPEIECSVKSAVLHEAYLVYLKPFTEIYDKLQSDGFIILKHEAQMIPSLLKKTTVSLMLTEFWLWELTSGLADVGTTDRELKVPLCWKNVIVFCQFSMFYIEIM